MMSTEKRLLEASASGQVGTVRKLLRTLPKIDVNARDDLWSTPLAKACQDNHVEVAKLLLIHGARAESTNNIDLRPIDLVSYTSDLWDVLKSASKGVMPELEDWSEIPIIPDFSIPDPDGTRKKKRGKKKGKKGKKGGKGKKKGKKKKR